MMKPLIRAHTSTGPRILAARFLIGALSIMLVLAAFTVDPADARNRGRNAVKGAVIGAGVGVLVGGKRGAAAGAVAGAVVGAIR